MRWPLGRITGRVRGDECIRLRSGLKGRIAGAHEGNWQRGGDPSFKGFRFFFKARLLPRLVSGWVKVRRQPFTGLVVRRVAGFIGHVSAHL